VGAWLGVIAQGSTGLSTGQWIALVVFMWGIISALAGLYAKTLRDQVEECCRERDALQQKSDALLMAYQARDEEERRALRERSQR
jgi:hypothetical protein